MKKNRFLILVIITFGFLNTVYCQSDLTIRYQKNGVEVHKAQGVEKINKEETNRTNIGNKPNNSVEGWDIDQCVKATADIEAKIAHLKSQGIEEENLLPYYKELEAIRLRKEKLTAVK